MRIIVTGGLGFLGINLLKKLVEEKEDIVCLDHFGSSDSKNFKLAGDMGVHVIKHDINYPLKIKGSIGQIYHMASRASPADYQLHPVETAMTGSLGTANMLQLAREKKARVLFTSTSEVYGDPKEFPQKELYWGNVNPVGIRSCYDESKRFGEALMMAFHRQYGVDIKIVRIFNSYGPGMRIDDGRAIPNFIYQAIRDKPITVYGDGSQTRSFCYVEDTIEGIHTMMNIESFIGPVNIGNPEEIKIIDLAKMIIEISNSKSKPIFKPLPFDDPAKRIPSIETAKQRLNWQPRISLREGLMRTIGYYQGLMKESGKSRG